MDSTIEILQDFKIGDLLVKILQSDNKYDKDDLEGLLFDFKDKKFDADIVAKSLVYGVSYIKSGIESVSSEGEVEASVLAIFDSIINKKQIESQTLGLQHYIAIDPNDIRDLFLFYLSNTIYGPSYIVTNIKFETIVDDKVTKFLYDAPFEFCFIVLGIIRSIAISDLDKLTLIGNYIDELIEEQ